MRVELTHDLLAKKIREAVSEKNRDLLYAQKIMDSKYELYLSNPNILLSDIELHSVKPYIDRIFLTQEQSNFFNLSEKECEKKAFWAYLKNIINIASILIIIGLMIIMTQYQKNAKRQEQNIHLAQMLSKILKDLSTIKTAKDLAMAQNHAKHLRSNLVTAPELRELFQEKNKSIDSIKEELLETPAAEMQMRKTSVFYSLKGKVVDINNKGIKNATITLKEKSISIQTDEAGYFDFLLESSLILQESNNTLLIEAKNYQSIEIPQLHEQLKEIQDNGILDLDRIKLLASKE